MRWLGALVLAVVVVVGLLTLLGQGPAVPGLGLGAAPPAEAPALGYSASVARLVQTDAAGAPLYSLEAATLNQAPNSQDVLAQDLTLRYQPPEAAATAPAPWTLTSRQGTLPAGSLTVKLTGGVRLDGRPAGAREPLRLETAALDFDIPTQVARTRLPVTLWSGSRRLSARGLTANLKQGTVRLESSVHGRFPP